MTEALFMSIPELNAKVRCTNDGHSSVFDLIAVTGRQKDPHKVWKRLLESHPELPTKCRKFKFPGRGQRETPITDLQGWLYILALLPGTMGKKYREDAAQLVTRYLKGDQTLVDEIKDRQPVTPSPATDISDLDMEIRCTSAGQYSVHDLIDAVSSYRQTVKEIWKSLLTRDSKPLFLCTYAKFPGSYQQLTPVVEPGNVVQLLGYISKFLDASYKEDSANLIVQHVENKMKNSLAKTTAAPTATAPAENPLSVSSPIEQGRQFTRFVLEILDGINLGETPDQDRAMKIGLAISATQAQIPELTKGLEPVKLALVSAAHEDQDGNDVYLTPTALGKRLGVGARAMNNRLKIHGLQKKNRDFSKGQSTWLPTEEGKEYSILTIEERKGDDPTRYEHLKWSERVLELFENPLAA